MSADASGKLIISVNVYGATLEEAARALTRELPGFDVGGGEAEIIFARVVEPRDEVEP